MQLQPLPPQALQVVEGLPDYNHVGACPTIPVISKIKYAQEAKTQEGWLEVLTETHKLVLQQIKGLKVEERSRCIESILQSMRRLSSELSLMNESDNIDALNGAAREILSNVPSRKRKQRDDFLAQFTCKDKKDHVVLTVHLRHPNEVLWVLFKREEKRAMFLHREKRSLSAFRRQYETYKATEKCWIVVIWKVDIPRFPAIWQVTGQKLHLDEENFEKSHQLGWSDGIADASNFEKYVNLWTSAFPKWHKLVRASKSDGSMEKVWQNWRKVIVEYIHNLKH